MIRRPPRSTRVRSSAASDVYKRQLSVLEEYLGLEGGPPMFRQDFTCPALLLSLIHISEPTRLLSISYAVFCLKKKKKNNNIKKKKKKKKKKIKKTKKNKKKK